MSCSKARSTLLCLLLYRGYVMTEIYFTNSASVAQGFAVKLLSGLLNVRPNYDADGCPLFEAEYSDSECTTQGLKSLRPQMACLQMTLLEIGDVEVDPGSHQSQSEMRRVRVHAKEGENGRSRLYATFIVYREYLDGEEAQGWTRWQARYVTIILPDGEVKLARAYLNDQDREPIWGTRIEP